MDRRQRISNFYNTEYQPALDMVSTCCPSITFNFAFCIKFLLEDGRCIRPGIYEEVLGMVYVLQCWIEGVGTLTSSIAPAASAVKYETQHFDLPPIAEGPFIGKGDDVDARWDYISASV